MARSRAATIAVSVISMCSTDGSSPYASSLRRTTSHRSWRWNWTPDTLTAIGIGGSPALRHSAACAQARSSTHSPIGTINPEASAIGMNEAGEM